MSESQRFSVLFREYRNMKFARNGLNNSKTVTQISLKHCHIYLYVHTARFGDFLMSSGGKEINQFA